MFIEKLKEAILSMKPLPLETAETRSIHEKIRIHREDLLNKGSDEELRAYFARATLLEVYALLCGILQSYPLNEDLAGIYPVLKQAVELEPVNPENWVHDKLTPQQRDLFYDFRRVLRDKQCGGSELYDGWFFGEVQDVTLH